jgi:hypothetical protein
MINGSGQAPVIAYDIQSGIKKNWLIEGLRSGWTKKGLREVMLNYKGQWYIIDYDLLFSDNIYKFIK